MGLAVCTFIKEEISYITDGIKKYKLKVENLAFHRDVTIHNQSRHDRNNRNKVPAERKNIIIESAAKAAITDLYLFSKLLWSQKRVSIAISISRRFWAIILWIEYDWCQSYSTMCRNNFIFNNIHWILHERSIQKQITRIFYVGWGYLEWRCQN